MKILLFNQYFPPETNSIANRWGYFCEYLAKKGHEIFVLTSLPKNYFIKEGVNISQNKWFIEERYQNITITKFKTLHFKHYRVLNRWLARLSFSLMSYRYSLNIPSVDLIIAVTPPDFISFNAFKIARKRNNLLVIDVNDLLIENSINRLRYRFNLNAWLLQLKLRKIYEQAHALIVSTPALKKYLTINYGISQNKILYLPNGADIEFFNQEVDSSFIERQYNLFGNFVVSYVGFLGRYQEPEIIVDTAYLLKDYKDIKFLIVGTGPLEQKLKIKAKKLKLDNIIFTGLVPHTEINKYIKISDVCLVLYKNESSFRDNISSKIFEYLAAKKPIIINLEGEASRLIQEAQAGLLIKPSSPMDLKEAILKLYQDKFLREKMGLEGYSYVANNFNREDLSRKLEQSLYDLIEEYR